MTFNAASKVRTCLWFASGGIEAVRFYTSLVPDSEFEVVLEGENPDDPLLINFALAGTPYQVLSAQRPYDQTPTSSISVLTDDQDETDRLWRALLEDGGEEMACGWLTDRFGISWQIVPKRLMELQTDPDPERARRAFEAMQQMIKFDIAELEAAADGKGSASDG